MRVIAGSARGGKLETPKGEHTRPTLSKVKEAVFSMIHFDIPGAKVLDLFSGSGQMGIETISRGASHCVFVDSGSQSISAITKNIKHLKFTSQSNIVNRDVLQYLSSTTDKFDIVIMDPPYGFKKHKEVLNLVSKIVNENYIIVCESGKELEYDQNIGCLNKHKEYNYGITKIVVYRNK